MVTRFDRAILRALIGKTAVALIVVVGLYLAVDLFESVRRFGNIPGVDFTLIGLWDLLKLPGIFIQIAPLALLIAGVLEWHSLLTSGELTAWRSGGIGLVRLTRPFVLLALTLGALNVAIGDWVMPISDPLMRNISKVKFGEPLPDDVEGDWLRMPDGAIFRLHFPPKAAIPTDLTRILFDAQQQPQSLLRANITTLTPNGVVLGSGVILTREADGWHRVETQGQTLTLPPSVRESMERRFNPHRFSSMVLVQQMLTEQLPESTLIQIEKALWERGQILLLPAALILLVPLIGGLNPRSGGAAWRVMTAIGVGYGFHAVEEITRHIAEAGTLPRGIAILGPTLLLATALGALLRQRDARL